MIQATATVSPFVLYWREMALFFLGSAAFNQLVAIAVTDKVFMRAFERCKDQILAKHAEWTRERTKELDETISTVGQHADALEYIDASLKEQGRALSSQLADHFNKSTEALQEVSRALSAVQREANATAIAVGRLEGRMQSWDGRERRQ